MAEIKLINKDTDLSKLQRIGWDATLGGKRLEVYRLDGYNHTLGGKFSENCYWCCYEGETPTHKNLMQFSGHTICWGIRFETNNYTKTKWDETEVREGSNCVITRNGEDFFDVSGGSLDYCLSKARQILFELQEHPISFFEKGFEERIIGRKVFYRDQPAIIASYFKGGRLVIKAENPDGFTPAAFELDRDYPRDDEDKYQVITDILSPHIWWWRKEEQESK